MVVDIFASLWCHIINHSCYVAVEVHLRGSASGVGYVWLKISVQLVVETISKNIRIMTLSEIVGIELNLIPISYKL